MNIPCNMHGVLAAFTQKSRIHWYRVSSCTPQKMNQRKRIAVATVGWGVEAGAVVGKSKGIRSDKEKNWDQWNITRVTNLSDVNCKNCNIYYKFKKTFHTFALSKSPQLPRVLVPSSWLVTHTDGRRLPRVATSCTRTYPKAWSMFLILKDIFWTPCGC